MTNLKKSSTTWILRTNDYKQSPLIAEILSCEKKAIITLSLKKLGLFWGLAIVCIIVPLLHFILVPAFLIIGVHSFRSQYRNTHYLKNGVCTCPACNSSFILTHVYFFEDKKISCESCGEQLVILKA